MHIVELNLPILYQLALYEMKFDQNKIIYTRSMQQFSGLFPKTDYPEMIKFYDAIYKADRNKLVFIKTTDEEQKAF